MPYLPKKPCAHRGCPSLVRPKERWCPEHRREQHKARDAGRAVGYRKRYGTRHRHWRRKVLSRDPFCKICEWAPSTVADHIRPIEDGGSQYDLKNGQGLCKPCHDRKTMKEAKMKGTMK